MGQGIKLHTAAGHDFRIFTTTPPRLAPNGVDVSTLPRVRRLAPGKPIELKASPIGDEARHPEVGKDGFTAFSFARVVRFAEKSGVEWVVRTRLRSTF